MKTFEPKKTAKELGLKVGQKFLVVDDSDNNNVSKGDVVTLVRDDNSYNPFFSLPNSVRTPLYWESLTYPTPSWDNLQAGNIIVNRDGGETKVLAVIEDVFLSSLWGSFGIAGDWNTISEAKSYGWKLKDAPEEDITELTLEEVAKLAGVDVEKLRIK